jgi:hypothetical protein
MSFDVEKEANNFVHGTMRSWLKVAEQNIPALEGGIRSILTRAIAAERERLSGPTAVTRIVDALADEGFIDSDVEANVYDAERIIFAAIRAGEEKT